MGLFLKVTQFFILPESTIDNIFSFLIKNGSSSKPHFLPLRLSQMETVIHSLHVALWEVILWSDPENLWSLSRPLLPLILIDQSFFQQYAEALVSHQPPEIQKILTQVLFF
jgi:exportin-7